jgi:hypothetical protein
MEAFKGQTGARTLDALHSALDSDAGRRLGLALAVRMLEAQCMRAADLAGLAGPLARCLQAEEKVGGLAGRSAG